MVDEPKLFIASIGGEHASQSVNIMYEKAKEPEELEILEGSAHGTFIFEEEPESGKKIKQLVMDFLNNI